MLSPIQNWSDILKFVFILEEMDAETETVTKRTRFSKNKKKNWGKEGGFSKKKVVVFIFVERSRFPSGKNLPVFL